MGIFIQWLAVLVGRRAVRREKISSDWRFVDALKTGIIQRLEESGLWRAAYVGGFMAQRGLGGY